MVAALFDLPAGAMARTINHVRQGTRCMGSAKCRRKGVGEQRCNINVTQDGACPLPDPSIARQGIRQVEGESAAASTIIESN